MIFSRCPSNLSLILKLDIPGPEYAGTTRVQPDSRPPAQRHIFLPQTLDKPNRGGKSGRTARGTGPVKWFRVKPKSGEIGNQTGSLGGRASEAESGAGRRQMCGGSGGGQLATADTPQTVGSEAESTLNGGRGRGN